MATYTTHITGVTTSGSSNYYTIAEDPYDVIRRLNERVTEQDKKINELTATIQSLIISLARQEAKLNALEADPLSDVRLRLAGLKVV